MRPAFLLAFLLVPCVASAGDVTLGVGIGAGIDLPDAAATAHGTHFGPGPSLALSARYGLGTHARLRATLREDMESGNDRITWGQQIDGQDVRFYDETQKAYLVSTGLTIGADGDFTHGSGFIPYIGAELGIAMVSTYHSNFSDSTAGILIDQSDEKAADTGYLDPYSSQAAFLTDLHLGGRIPVAAGVAAWVETGYSLAFLNASPLKRVPDPSLDARREAYGWNAARLGVGVSFAL